MPLMQAVQSKNLSKETRSGSALMRSIISPDSMTGYTRKTCFYSLVLLSLIDSQWTLDWFSSNLESGFMSCALYYFVAF